LEFRIELQLQSVTDAGDHILAICQVVRTGVWDERKQTVRVLKGEPIMAAAAPPLDSTTVLCYTGQLREEGIIEKIATMRNPKKIFGRRSMQLFNKATS
jgi:hypothetical protein